MPFTCMVVRLACVVMVMLTVRVCHRVVQRLMAGRLNLPLALHARRANRAQHGCGDRAPCGEQHSHQDQQADAKGFHVEKVSTRFIQRFSGCSVTCVKES